MQVTKIALAVALAFTSQAQATTTNFSQFTPIGASAGVTATPATPITLGNPNWTQATIADRATQNAQVPGSNSGSWDMITANETGPDAGRYLFMPFETNTAGVQRIDLHTGITTTIVASGTQGFVSGDASRWTPWGTYLTAEESWGSGSSKGRLFEVTNPTTAGANGGNFVQRNIIPRVAHEGLAFDKQNNLYFVDELNGGSLYKYVSAKPNATNGNDYFNAGQTFVLRVGSGGQFEGNNGPAITGAASWVAITSPTGTPTADTFGSMVNLGGGSFALDGRTAADVPGVKGTQYNRPEDLEIQTLANGNQLLYIPTTDSDNNGNTADGRSRVYTFNLATNEMNLFADSNTIDLATGLAVGGAFRNADNIAIDADGNIYIVEDRDGAVDDDIWAAKDINHDGDLLDAGEGLARWASNGTPGSEFTGLYFDKFNPNVAYVNIQHPNDGIDRTIRISAVPEPETYGMFLAGLGLMGFVARRNRKA